MPLSKTGRDRLKLAAIPLLCGVLGIVASRGDDAPATEGAEAIGAAAAVAIEAIPQPAVATVVAEAPLEWPQRDLAEIVARTPFAMPVSLRPPLPEPAEVTQVDDTEVAEHPAGTDEAPGLPELKLMAVYESGGKVTAIVNGEVLQVGDVSATGLKVREIRADAVIFEAPDLAPAQVTAR